jgi:hypothetical protein
LPQQVSSDSQHELLQQAFPASQQLPPQQLLPASQQLFPQQTPVSAQHVSPQHFGESGSQQFSSQQEWPISQQFPKQQPPLLVPHCVLPQVVTGSAQTKLKQLPEQQSLLSVQAALFSRRHFAPPAPQNLGLSITQRPGWPGPFAQQPCGQ